MNTFQSRRRRALIAGGAAGASLVLAAAPSSRALGQSRAPAGRPLKIGFVHVGSVDDVGWTHQHDLGRKALERELGDAIETVYAEHVPEGQDAERVIREMLAQGRRLIFSTAYGFMDPTVRIAREFPDCVFENATGFKISDNVAVYNARFYEGRYLAGLIAANASDSGVIGYVAAVPIPEVLQGINAFTIAARTVNPKLEVRVIWVNSWYDPARERDAAFSLISQGADLLTHHTDTIAVAEVAEQKGRLLIGYHSDLSRVAPSVHLASVTHHWGRYYIDRTRAVLDGTWTTGQVWGGIADDFVRIESVSPKLPAPVRRQVRTVTSEIADGKVQPFSGLIRSNDGKVRQESGAMSDELLQKMDWLAEGVIGRVR